MMNPTTTVFLAGHRGMVGSAILRQLQTAGYTRIITRSRSDLDLTNQADVEAFFDANQIGAVILAAARVGGIHANNSYPAEFIYQNLMIEANVIDAAYRSGVSQLLFLGSSCIYPKSAPQPLREEYLLTGALEPTNAPYALAKIAGIKLCESYNRQYGTRFRAAMPTNLYGPNDNYDLETSHVLPALIRKFHLAKLAARGAWQAIATDARVYGAIPAGFLADLYAIARAGGHPPPQDLQIGTDFKVHAARAAVQIWGSGSPRREFLHVDDMARACTYLMTLPDAQFEALAGHLEDTDGQAPIFVNVGTGIDITIADLAELIRSLVGFEGDIYFDHSKPDGTPRKLLDVSRLTALGWQPQIDIRSGIERAYKHYRLALQ